MVHWRFLMRTAAIEELYDAVIPVAQLIWDSDDEDQGEEEKITHTIDYSSSASPLLKSNNPPDGYGPANAAQLVINNQGDSVQNADNYRWYVVSKYWQWICKRQFDKQDDPDKDDKMIPPESNGQVPYPGEVLQEQDPPPQARLFAML